MQDHYSKLSEQFKACKSKELTNFGEDYALPIDKYGKCMLINWIMMIRPINAAANPSL